MILKAYNPAWARAKATREAAARWQKQGLLSPAQLDSIYATHPLDYYRPHIFLRIALFIFTCLGSGAASGFFSLFGLSNYFLVVCVLSALGCLVVLEIAIKSSKLYHAGPDNALLYMTLGWLTALVFYSVSLAVPAAFRNSFSPGNPFLPLALIPVLGLLVAAVVRYADRLVSAFAFMIYILLIFNILSHSTIGRLLLPFALMLASAAAYYAVWKVMQHVDRFYYQACFTVLKALSLSVFYLSGNYLVVREGNALLNDMPASTQIPFAALFYFFTVSIPVAYVYVALRKHDRVWLLIGLLSAAFSCYTIRFYHSILPPEIAATFAGVVLIAFAIWALRYLHTPRHGLTSVAEGEEPLSFSLESLVVAQTAPSAPQPEPASFQFGGGHSGGGGADSSY
ncbi:hypothetical protein [Hymenobacter sp. BT491]|uniref:hypothetical protein n=1 Tax=Hymenobacter sp. BT491 TaxID=2766779 RepID=UPI001653CFDC|nr:hypothetical protein [Hymenobacter sp. BT491]MBC6991384.1 hypothetical protein [Hymenobacter sp. BT491]